MACGKMIACCGLDCEKCDAYIATKNNDNELFYFCSHLCPIRKCAAEKGFDHCGLCPEMDHPGQGKSKEVT